MDEDNTKVEGEQPSATVILSMEIMIKNHISSIDRLTEEMKKHKDMLEDIFKNDQTYQEHSEKSKEAARVKGNTKKQILSSPQAAELNEKVKSLKSQISEQQVSLSDYLQEYARMSGVSEIEGEDGEMRVIVYTAKLIKKTFR